MRTIHEVAAEIEALLELKPQGTWAAKTARTIKLQVEALRGEWDTTADEFFELSDENQMAINDADAWKRGDMEDRPSEGWGDLCA